MLDNIDRYLTKNNQPKILDIGCGSGLMLNALGRVGETYGMDVSDEAISFSKEIFNGRVEKGALPDVLPNEENFFDMITALDVSISEGTRCLSLMKNLSMRASM